MNFDPQVINSLWRSKKVKRGHKSQIFKMGLRSSIFLEVSYMTQVKIMRHIFFTFVLFECRQRSLQDNKYYVLFVIFDHNLIVKFKKGTFCRNPYVIIESELDHVKLTSDVIKGHLKTPKVIITEIFLFYFKHRIYDTANKIC